MTVVLVTPPSAEPITVDEARRHLRLDASSGEPAPIAPAVALISPAAAGNVDNGVHRYRVTFVTADGETEGGTVSDPVTVADKAVNGKVALSNIPRGGAAVTSRRIYRTAAGGSTYLLLATIADNTTTTYTDNTADSGLGAGAPSTNTTEDPELVRWIRSAREHIEKITGRALITQTLDLMLPCFPACAVLELPRAPLQSVTSVKYISSDGTETTWDAGNYVVSTGSDYDPGRLALAYGVSWPSFTPYPLDPVRIRYVAGYGASGASVPTNLRDAMLLLVGHWYANRETVITGTISKQLEFTVDALVGNYRLW